MARNERVIVRPRSVMSGEGKRDRVAALLCAVVLLAACDTRSDPRAAVWTSPIAFDTASVTIYHDGDSVRLLTEIAASPQQQQFGLMVRPSLDSMSSMIFVYESEQDATRGFWMHRTLVPLDIAYIDSAGAIVSIREMAPCDVPDGQTCPSYLPGVPYWSALEVNQGFFAERGIGVGDTVKLQRSARDSGPR